MTLFRRLDAAVPTWRGDIKRDAAAVLKCWPWVWGVLLIWRMAADAFDPEPSSSGDTLITTAWAALMFSPIVLALRKVIGDLKSRKPGR